MGIGKLLHQSNMDDQSLFDSGRWEANGINIRILRWVFSTLLPLQTPIDLTRLFETMNASRGIEGLCSEDKVRQGFKNAWVLGIGFKQPHTCITSKKYRLVSKE